VNHLVPLFFYSPLVAALFCVALRMLSVRIVIASAFAGYLVWTLAEYFGHRFLFHSCPQTVSGRRVHFLIHGVHHEYPSDPLRLVMPPLMSAPIIAAAWAVLRFVCGPELVLPVLAGFICGYVGYDMLHFHVHHGRPRTWLGRLLRHRHMHHHFRDDSSWFGVSAPWWDDIFGTSLERQAGRP
jgi:sterol desaturase/sphingolipid hydroxylase (fatty acid hydroxylase superfamily)